MSNTLWSLAIIALLLGFIVVGSQINRDGSRVMVWHNAVWIFVLALFASNLIAYYEASATSWLVLIVGLVAFNVAALLAFSSAENSKSGARIPNAVPSPVISRPFLYAATAIYFAAFTVYLFVLANSYGLDVLVSDPGSIRELSLDGESYLSNTPLVARIGLNLGPVLLVMYAVHDAVSTPLNVWFRVAMLAAISISMVAMLQRTNFFMAVLWYLAYLLSQRSLRREHSANTLVAPTSKRHLRKPKALLGFILGPLALFGSFQFLGNALGKTGHQAVSSGRVSDVLASSGLADIFSYATGAIPAFLQLVESDNFRTPPVPAPGTLLIGDYNPQTYGTASLGPITQLIPGVTPWNPIAPFIDVGILTNVFTWYEMPFRDFRLVGVLVYASLLGFGITWMFIRRFQSATIFWVQSALFSTVFLSVFIAKTSTLIFWTGIFVVVLTSQSLKRKRIRASRTTS